MIDGMKHGLRYSKAQLYSKPPDLQLKLRGGILFLLVGPASATSHGTRAIVIMICRHPFRYFLTHIHVIIVPPFVILIWVAWLDDERGCRLHEHLVTAKTTMARAAISNVMLYRFIESICLKSLVIHIIVNQDESTDRN